ncbi:hypothetical protein FHT79_006465 [Rhizobium sp. BK212]|uniref:hypothetical protein n=1 Tax=Rhizobium sp. BK212 TaxID=2587074 RepID=UPI00161C19D4|nr:hypothetical protein [Rhizobium sp. BK212]MBB4219234.1 hypothetical protein [Rhizobium sp. BK212]
MIPTWKIAEAKLSVEINGTFVPFKQAPDSLQRFVRPALFSTGEEKWELEFFGTSFLGKYRGWHFGLATGHQTDTLTGAPQAEKFVVLAEVSGRTLAIPPKNLHIPSVEHDQDQALRDLVFFDYGDVDPNHRGSHLELTKVLWSDDAGEPDYAFLVGYPTHSTLTALDPNDYSALSSFTARWIRQDLQGAKSQPLDTEHRNIFVKHERSTRLSIEPDGLSGSPVFSITRSANAERFLRFEGIVTNARGDRFAVYPSVYIRDMLDDIVGKALS